MNAIVEIITNDGATPVFLQKTMQVVTAVPGIKVQVADNIFIPVHEMVAGTDKVCLRYNYPVASPTTFQALMADMLSAGFNRVPQTFDGMLPEDITLRSVPLADPKTLVTMKSLGII